MSADPPAISPAVLCAIRGPTFRHALELVGWTPEILAERACLSVVEIARVLDDDEPITNAVINCLRALQAAGVRFRHHADRVTVTLLEPR